MSVCAPEVRVLPTPPLVALDAGGGKITEASGPPMPSPASGARRRSAAIGLMRLLERLDEDPTRAAVAYEQLRAALEKFFDWRGAWPPDECADITLDRLAIKLAGTTEIDDVRGYARGIARLVLLEWQRRPVPVSIDPAEHTYRPRLAEEQQQDQQLLACFDRCLAALSADSRALVLDYYVAERREKIDNRRRLARALGLSESALRNRVQRIRDRLERCVHACTGGQK